jgi:subtilase family serine protease
MPQTQHEEVWGKVRWISPAILLLSAFWAAAQSSPRTVLTGHVPKAVAHLQPAGRLEGSQRLRLAIGLAPRDEPGLDSFLQQLYDPASPNYRRYLTLGQLTERFGPTEHDYQALIEYAKASGLTVTRQFPHRVVLDVEGAVADIETAFQVTLRTYRHPEEPRLFYAPDAEPSLALAVSVLHISGLDNYTLPHPKQKHRSLNQSAGETLRDFTPKEGSAPNSQLWGNDFRNAYVPGTTLTGTGQNVGLLEFDGFFPSDITNYETAIKMNATNRPQLVIVPVDGGVSSPGSYNSEVAGDIEMTVSMAPGLNAIYVFEDGGPIYNSYFDHILAAMVTYTNVLQFSCSWGGSTAQDPTSEVLFKEMDALGQSFYDASGDAGAFVGDVQFPSDSPSITQVGGTTLADGSAPSYPWEQEVVWAWDSGPYVSGRAAESSSGGISTYYPIPWWQTNINMEASLGSTNMRNIPDVAANADNVYLYYNGGTEEGRWGGTSFAAPLWAGFTALVNQQAAAYGMGPVGFLNPALYALASGTNYANLFHDITSGNDTWRESPGQFYAVAGYDLCTGLGSMNGTNLINALVGPIPTPSFLSPAAGAGGFTLAWSTVAGISYQVQYSSDLTTPNWINIGSPITASGPVTTLSDSFASSQRFYRVLLLPKTF